MIIVTSATRDSLKIYLNVANIASMRDTTQIESMQNNAKTIITTFTGDEHWVREDANLIAGQIAKEAEAK